MFKNLPKDLFVINEPMKRETYFKFSICLIALQVLLVLLFTGINFVIKVPAQFVLLFLALMAFVLIPFLYMYFIICTKRIWDITDDKFNAIWISAIAFIFCIIKFPLFILMFIILVLIPSRGK